MGEGTAHGLGQSIMLSGNGTEGAGAAADHVAPGTSGISRLGVQAGGVGWTSCA